MYGSRSLKRVDRACNHFADLPDLRGTMLQETCSARSQFNRKCTAHSPYVLYLGPVRCWCIKNRRAPEELQGIHLATTNHR